MADLTIPQGATLPKLTTTIKDSVGPVPLSGGTVELLYTLDGGALVTRSGAIVSASEGKAEYAWVSGDTAVAGSIRFRWRVTWGDDVMLSDWDKIRVTP